MSNPKRKGISGGGVIAVVLVIVGLSMSSQEKKAEATAPTCKTEWSKCSDNRDMANNSTEWHDAKVACIIATNDKARYGTPEYSLSKFSHFLTGNDYVTSGQASLIDEDTKFSNVYGAMVRSRVECRYDLREKRVLSVLISGR